MNTLFAKVAALGCAVLLSSNLVYANSPLKGKVNHLYVLKITSTTGKQIPINGTMIQSPVNAPVAFYDFKASNFYTPYEGTLAAEEIMLNLASLDANNSLKVEISCVDNDVPSLTGSGNYIMLYNNGGSGSFISTRSH